VSTKVLPDGWTLKKFSAIATSITERVDDPSASGVERYVGLEHLDPESTIIRRWGSPSDVEATKLRFYPGDVIYGRRRAYQRKLGVADFDGICSAHALVLRAKPDVCMPEFLPYFLQSDAFHQRALDISVGSLSPTINWKTLAVQEFALPPIAEQQKVCQMLSTMDCAIGATWRSLAEMQLLYQALLNSADLETVKKVRIGDVLRLERGVSYKSSDYTEDGVGRPFLTLKSVTREGTFSESGTKWVRDDFSPDNVVRPGQLFFANTDLTPGRLLVGAPFFFTGIRAASPPCFSMDLTRVELTRDGISLELVYHLLNTPRVRSSMRAMTGGSTVGHLQLSRVPEIEIPDPVDLSRLLPRLQMMDETRSILLRKVSVGLEFRRALLEKLMGSVHVH